MESFQEYVGTILAVISGIGLSAACGFRIFVPLLALNLASLGGIVHLSPGFEWIGGQQATIAFAIATVLEIIAYYVPWLDNVMDAIASPVSVIAGVIASASLMADLPPPVKWTVAIIAGGGAAGLFQGATTALRLKSSLFTGGLGNFLVATLELLGSAVTSFLALLLPIIGFVLVAILILYFFFEAIRRFLKKRKVDAGAVEIMDDNKL